MNDHIHDEFRTVAGVVGADLQAMGFKPTRGGTELLRSAGAVQQRLAMSLRAAPADRVGYLEVFPGFNIAELESLAAELQGRKPRPGFITCSLNIGLLTPANRAAEWALGSGDDPVSVARLVVDAVRTSALPFWEEFASVGDLLARFDTGDRRVCRGAEWPWRRVAACVMTGNSSRAVALLEQMRADAPPAVRATVDRALQRLSASATR